MGTFFSKNSRIGAAASLAADVVREAVVDNTDSRAAGRRRYLIAAWSESIITSLISGIYFTGLLLAVGADDIFIGYVQMATTFCGILQFFAPLLLERMKRRKTYLLIMRSVYHMFNIVVIGLIPLLPLSRNAALGAFIVCVIIVNLVSAFSTMGLNVWKIQSVPENRHNAFFSVLNIGTSIIGKLAAYAAGQLLDLFERDGITLLPQSPTVCAMLILRGAAVLFAAAELLVLAGLREEHYVQDAEARNNRGLRLLLRPLRDRRFMTAVSIMLLFAFFTAIPGQFFDVYLINEVGISYAYISVCSMIVLPISLVMTAVWSVLLQRFAWRRMLAVAMFGYSFAYFFNLPVTPEAPYFYLWIQVCCCLFNPCFSIVFAYLPYQNMPEENRTAYLGFQSLATTVVSFVGNVVGTQFIHLTQGKTLTVFGQEMINIRYIMIIPFLALILLSVWIYIAGGLLQKDSAAPKLPGTGVR